MAGFSSDQLQFTSIYSKMRRISTKFPNLQAEFDRAFSNSLCNFNPLTFIENKGHIGLDLKVTALRDTLQQTATFANEYYHRISEDDPNKDEWLHLSSTFWNDFMRETLDELEQHVSGITMTSLHHALPDDTPPAHRTRGKKQSKPPQLVRQQQPDRVVRSDIVDALSKIRGRIPLYRGHTACRNQDCSSCLQIFDNIPLTRCAAVHPKTDWCVQPGWFPHLTSSQWNALRHVHNQMDTFDFRPRHPGVGEKENPFRQKPYGKRNVAKAILEPSTEQLVEKSSPSSSPRSPGNLTWNDQIDWVPESPPPSGKRKVEEDEFVPKRRTIDF